MRQSMVFEVTLEITENPDSMLTEDWVRRHIEEALKSDPEVRFQVKSLAIEPQTTPVLLYPPTTTALLAIGNI